MRKSDHREGQAAFRKLMRTVRHDADLTQAELAKRLRRPQSFVAKYESGERRLDVIEFVTITRAIGADPVRLLKSLLRRGV